MKKNKRLKSYFDGGALVAEDPGDVAVLGTAIGHALANSQRHYDRGARPIAYKEASLDALLGNHSIYGRMSIFDCCSSGDIFGLQVQTVGFMNWLGWRPNRFYKRRVDFIPWIGPTGTVACTNVTGAGSPCEDPTGWEYGYCGYDLVHTSWYHRGGDALTPHTVIQERCETSPRYRVNGAMIRDDVEWQMNGIMTVLQQDMRRDIVHGAHANSYQMDGLESIIKTGYEDNNGVTCPAADSVLVNWNFDDLDGAVNGNGNFFDYLDELVTETEYRASMIGTIAETDMVLFTTRFMATCLLDAYACYTTCGVTSENDVTDQALRRAQREMRMALNGGPLYDGASAVGFIQLKSGRRLPIMVDDAMDITKGAGTWCTDIYLLTRKIGSIDVLYGEFLDMREYENRIRRQMPDFTARADSGGRFVVKGKEDNWCVTLMMGTSPEIYLSAPWAQVRISDVCCARKRQPLTGDPYQKFYLPGGKPLHVASSRGGTLD